MCDVSGSRNWWATIKCACSDPEASAYPENSWLEMSAKSRRHVANKAKCRPFLSRQANFGNMVFSVSEHFCVMIFRHWRTTNRPYLYVEDLILTWNVDLYITAPPNKHTQKSSALHPLTSRLHLLPRLRLTSLHPLWLFVHPFCWEDVVTDAKHMTLDC